MPWFGTAIGTDTEPCSVIIYEITIEKNVVVRSGGSKGSLSYTSTLEKKMVTLYRV